MILLFLGYSDSSDCCCINITIVTRLAKNDSHPSMPPQGQVAYPELETYDTTLRRGLEEILNVSLNDLQWTRTSLCIKMGGLDIRRASSLALPVFLASAASTLSLQTLTLTSLHITLDTHVQDMSSEWCSASESNYAEIMPTYKQSHTGQTTIASDCLDAVPGHS